MHLFTGENSFELLREKVRWIVEFSKKYGEENVSRIDGSVSSMRSLLDEVSVLPFLAEKRLIVIEGIPKSSKEDIALLIQCIHPAALVLIVDAKPDKRSGGVKEILKCAVPHVFDPLVNAALQKWMQSYAIEKGITLELSAIQALLEYTGSEQAILAQEIEKLASYVPGKKVSKNEVELLSLPTDEGIVWKISDLLASGNKQAALLFAHRLISRGGDAYGLWAILSSMLKNLVLVHAAAEAGMRSQEEVASATGIHPFAVRSLFQYCKRIHHNDLKEFLGWVASAERGLKTGEFRPTNEAPQEIDALVDAFILKSP